MNTEEFSSAAPEQKQCKFRLTPERFIWAVLFVELFLWLSEYFRWFSFNEKKGLTVLIALAVLVLAILWFALWYVSALVHRRRFQFGIRTLLVLTVAVAIPFSWLETSIQRAKRDGEFTSYLREKFSCHIGRIESLRVPVWLSNILGDNFFTQINTICEPDISFADEDLKRCYELAEVDSIILDQSAITDAGLETIGRLKRLKFLNLSDTTITDAGLKHLENLQQLEGLDLTGTNTTESGRQALQLKLPHCKISW